MPIDVFLMVLMAALLHASWNALVKADGDRLALIKVLSSTQLVLSLCLVPFVSAPAPDSYPYIAASGILNIGYMLFMNRAYQAGDLSLIYPLARGVAPLVVAGISIWFLGEQLSHAGKFAILLIALGVASLALARGIAHVRDLRPVLLALTTGGFIASYTIVDGMGARAAGTAHGYMVWVSLVAACLTVGSIHWLQRGRRDRIGQRSLVNGIASGVISYTSSWMVIWAMTLAPIALVSALRETGVVFAVIIGVVVLKERLNLARLLSIATALIGTAILKFSR